MTSTIHKPQTNTEFSLHENSGAVFHKGKIVGTLGYTERKLLIFLINKNGSEAARHELTEAGWPGRVLVPNSLNMSIRKIRLFFKKLGVNELIITIPKYGFCLPKPQIFNIIKHEEIFQLLFSVTYKY